MRNEEMREFGEALARYRSEAGLNQRQLAAAIGLDSTQVNKIERGHRPPLDAKYMKPLVHALRLSRSEALDLVQKADLSPKVLDFMDEVQTAVHPRIMRKKVAIEKSNQKPVGHSRVLKSGTSAISTPMPTMAGPALALPDSLFYITFDQIEAIVESAHHSEEEMRWIAVGLIESTKMLSKLAKLQHQK